ncbi:hypothetical protein [Streptomyces sp. NPDC001530]|uniref:hypothetical protein n=1 Tax=Streptomyces sp. NPDC001530 TaxID=3364582 RepID=UPI0036C9104D
MPVKPRVTPCAAGADLLDEVAATKGDERRRLQDLVRLLAVHETAEERSAVIDRTRDVVRKALA